MNYIVVKVFYIDYIKFYVKMKSNPKLIRFSNNFYNKANRKILIFKLYFTSSIFSLFCGFLGGNLFGSLLNIFQESIIWHGFITIYIIIIVEIINFSLYHNKNRQFFLFNYFPLNLNSKKPHVIYIEKTFIRINYLHVIFKNCIHKTINFIVFITSIVIDKLLPSSLTTVLPIYYINIIYNNFSKEIFIKNINLCKIGILLGFFIDAFKVGS